MKVFCLLAVCALAVAVNAFPEDDATHIHGENGWYIPQADRSFVWMNMDDAENMLDEMEAAESRMEGRVSMTPVSYYLYTQSNPKGKGKQISASAKSISKSNFNPANPTRFVIHGWTQGHGADMNTEIRDAWLSHGDLNIIIVDWARARSLDYISSVAAVPTVGKKIAGMIDYLVRNHGMSLDTLEVIGHSLGAHCAGYAGKNVKSGQVHSIVGLDPALPLFNYKKPNKRLSSTDAFYVESIQTDGGQLGFLRPIGKGAFYPNGGKVQPGCKWDPTGACAHGRSVIYYAEAVAANNFPSQKCDGYQNAVDNSCGNTYSSVHMGATTNAYMVGGDFYVPVNSKAPWGMGN